MLLKVFPNPASVLAKKYFAGGIFMPVRQQAFAPKYAREGYSTGPRQRTPLPVVMRFVELNMERPAHTADTVEAMTPSTKKVWHAPKVIVSDSEIADTRSNVGLGSDLSVLHS